MSKTMLTQEQIDTGVNDAKAAVAKARQALDQSRAARARIGVTPEKLQRFMNRLTPYDRVWINSLVASSVAQIRSQPAAVKAAPRNPRRMV